MDKMWEFYPHPGGKKLRGLEIYGGLIYWAACRTNDTRTESIFVPGPVKDVTVEVGDTSVVTASIGKVPVSNHYPVHIKSVGPGSTWIGATRGDDTAYMDVTVFPKLTMHLAFKKVETEAWKSTFTSSKMQRLIENLNYIYSYQGNVAFVAVGTPQKVTIPGLANVVPTDDVVNWGQYRNSGADTTIFFVKENDALAVNWTDLIIMEDSQGKPWDEMTCAHEIGHRMNLRHPAPPLSFNLMNQTAVGDRDRMKIYLTHTQIDTVTDKSKWKVRADTGTDADVCEAPH